MQFITAWQEGTGNSTIYRKNYGLKETIINETRILCSLAKTTDHKIYNPIQIPMKIWFL